MNANKYTQKSLEVIQNAQNLAVSNQNAQIEEEHLLMSLLKDEDSLVRELFKKMGVSNGFEVEISNKINNMPKITGGARRADSIYVSQDVDLVLTEAESIAEKMRDEYVSVEHLMISLLDHPTKDIKALFKKYNITKNDFLKALSSVRGNTRVTSDNPESTYDVLKKYGQDLVDLAKNQKLDPVIGRDTEIRNVIFVVKVF